MSHYPQYMYSPHNVALVPILFSHQTHACPKNVKSSYINHVLSQSWIPSRFLRWKIIFFKMICNGFLFNKNMKFLDVKLYEKPFIGHYPQLRYCIGNYANQSPNMYMWQHILCSFCSSGIYSSFVPIHKLSKITSFLAKP